MRWWQSFDRRVASIHELKESAHPGLCLWRTGDDYGVALGLAVKIVDEKKRQATEVITVKMAENDRIQAARVKTGALHREQGRRPAIEEKQPVAGLDQIPALMAPTTAEGVAAAKNVKSHRPNNSPAQILFKVNNTHTPRRYYDAMS